MNTWPFLNYWRHVRGLLLPQSLRLCQWALNLRLRLCSLSSEMWPTTEIAHGFEALDKQCQLSRKTTYSQRPEMTSATPSGLTVFDIFKSTLSLGRGKVWFGLRLLLMGLCFDWVH